MSDKSDDEKRLADIRAKTAGLQKAGCANSDVVFLLSMLERERERSKILKQCVDLIHADMENLKSALRNLEGQGQGRS